MSYTDVSLGGLSTSYSSLTANIWLAAGVAVTGIATPIGLSYMLVPLVRASSLQCFTAGVALCSTSLGTTITVLRASGLSSTRLGVVLTSAAILDDVVGLVLVQVITNLATGIETSVSPITVIRPILVSVALVALTLLLCRFVLQPITILLNKKRTTDPNSRLDDMLRRPGFALSMHSILLVGLVAASSYAGTSNLFAAYIAGSILSWWYSEVPHMTTTSDQVVITETENTTPDTNQRGESDAEPSSGTHPTPIQNRGSSGMEIFETYYRPAVVRILQPFFFASIGFSIPIRHMFSGYIIWRGIVYASLMIAAKVLCGLWLMPRPALLPWAKRAMKRRKVDRSAPAEPSDSPIELSRTTKGHGVDRPAPAELCASPIALSRTIPPSHENEASEGSRANPLSEITKADSSSTPANSGAKDDDAVRPIRPPSATPEDKPSAIASRNSSANPPSPISIYPALIVGFAMVPRGEIGFLISSLAQSTGVFGGNPGSGESDLFLITTWAIVLCTVLGPLCVGILVRRVKRLDSTATSSAKKTGEQPKDVLGVWGIS